MRDLNDLSFFAAVVANGGFSAAARDLELPKSRVSRRIAALETRLGVRLVERSSRRFSVTEVGQDVYRHARAALSEADAIEEAALRLRSEPKGLVRVACPPGPDRIMTARLPAFLLRHPLLRVQMISSNRRVDLIEEGVDVAIRIRETLDTDADLQVKIVGRTGSMVVASPAFLAAHGRPDAPADITALPTLGHTERPGLDRWVLLDDAGGEQAVVHEPRLSAGDYAIISQAALDGLGLALLPELICRERLAEGALERVLPDWIGRDGVLHLVFTSRRGLLPGVRAFIDFAAATLAPCSTAWSGADATTEPGR